MSERWSYAINQWKPNFDYFTRREQHERAFKTVSAAGFRFVELRAGTGRWEPLGRPEQIAANFGSARGLVHFLDQCGLEGVSSFFYDPGERNTEEPAPARSPTNPDDHDGILRSTQVFAEFLRETGGTCLVVRAMPSRWRLGAPSEQDLDHAAACWDAVGSATSSVGIQLALHVDFLSSLRSIDDIAALLDRTEPARVGFALDTAELWIAGIDPVAAARRLAPRVRHVHLKDARDRVGDEFAVDDAEKHVLLAGGNRRVERWFWEIGEGNVDVTGVVDALRTEGYEGVFVVESDQSPDPAASALLNGWMVQHVLAKS
jgi:inosose dehydratase